MPAPPSNILVCADSSPGEVETILQTAGFATTNHRNGHEPPALDPFQLILVDGGADADWALQLCEKLRQRQSDSFVPILYIADDSEPRSRVAGLESGADAYVLRPFEPGELLAQVQTFLRIKARHDVLTEKANEVARVNQRLHQAYHQIDMELELARRIQESFLPQKLPNVKEVQIGVRCRPCGRVGGDFYDVFRLDEQHLGFYVADAMGHGVPASLLTIFVKTAVKSKEIQNQTYRLVPPNEVLQRLNRQLIDQALADQPFVTMVYGLFNFRTGQFQFSRAGHPYPLYLPKEGPAQLWQLEGSLLGVFDVQFQLQSRQLHPGDKLFFYTDGMDAAGFDQSPVGIPSLLAGIERYRDLPVDEMVERLSRELFGQTKQTDDLTLFGMEFVQAPG